MRTIRPRMNKAEYKAYLEFKKPKKNVLVIGDLHAPFIKEGYLEYKEVAKIEETTEQKYINKYYQFTFDQTQTLERYSKGRNNKRSYEGYLYCNKS